MICKRELCALVSFLCVIIFGDIKNTKNIVVSSPVRIKRLLISLFRQGCGVEISSNSAQEGGVLSQKIQFVPSELMG